MLLVTSPPGMRAVEKLDITWERTAANHVEPSNVCPVAHTRPVLTHEKPRKRMKEPNLSLRVTNRNLNRNP